MHITRHTFFLSVLLCPLFLPCPFTFADILELNNGEVMECVIVSESIHDITIEVPLGKINIPKSSIAKTSRYSKVKNDALI